MTSATTHDETLESLLPAAIRAEVERRYYARIDERCRIEHAIQDPQFLPDFRGHIALFPDHGTVHVRDVATAFLGVLDAVHGRLIGQRSAERLGWMRAYGVLLSYLHDIGMAASTPYARAMHAEYVVQAAMGPELDWLVAALLANGGMPTERLEQLGHARAERMLRELMAMAMGHSKSRVPVDVLNDPSRFAATLRRAATTHLSDLHAEHLSAVGRTRPTPEVDGMAAEPATLVDDAAQEGAFDWLASDDPQLERLRDDAIDCVRVLRAADALRQRGTVLKTSGSYEIFIDSETAHAIYALRLSDGRSFLLELPHSANAAEANLASSELEPDGNLRFAFHHGRFRDFETTARAATEAARLISDVQQDVVQSFRRPSGEVSALARRWQDAKLLIETVDDNPLFAAQIIKALELVDPETAGRCRVVPSLSAASSRERSRYLRGSSLPSAIASAEDVLRRVAAMGHPVDGIDPVLAFADVRRVLVRAGEALIEAGDPSGFVYIPEGDGLAGLPLGGYPGFRVRAWSTVGTTGVVRGAARNSTIVAEVSVTLLAIPRDTYLQYWHRTYRAAELANVLVSITATGTTIAASTPSAP